VAKRKNWKNDPWYPDENYLQHVPEVSGDDFNGVGETDYRRPQQIFWHRKLGDQPFAPLQQAFMDRFEKIPQLSAVYAEADRGPRKVPEIDAEIVEATPEEWTHRIRAFALNQSDSRPEGYPGEGSEAELVGITASRQEYFYEGFNSTLSNIIMLGIVMDHHRLDQLPGDDQQVEGQLEVADQYNRGARVSNYLAQWIREQGYQALPHSGPWVGSLNMIPAAIAAGLGELGDHGSMINDQYGSSFRLAAVETDMPLVHDQPSRFGADEFCMRCQVCVNACPPQAISNEKKWVRGEYKYSVDFDKCFGYFYETYNCGICLAVCPWSTPDRAPKLAATWINRIENDS